MSFSKIYNLKDVFFALVSIDAELFSRVGRQSAMFCFVYNFCFFYSLVLGFFNVGSGALVCYMIFTRWPFFSCFLKQENYFSKSEEKDPRWLHELEGVWSSVRQEAISKG